MIMNYMIREERLTAETYIEFLKQTDLGVVRECVGQGIGTALVRKMHEIAGGEENIIMYTCFNENAYGFYEKLGMYKPDDVVVRNQIQWTDFIVE
jgi:GNAT superfamily N-acetyltransferase